MTAVCVENGFASRVVGYFGAELIAITRLALVGGYTRPVFMFLCSSRLSIAPGPE